MVPRRDEDLGADRALTSYLNLLAGLNFYAWRQVAQSAEFKITWLQDPDALTN